MELKNSKIRKTSFRIIVMVFVGQRNIIMYTHINTYLIVLSNPSLIVI